MPRLDPQAARNFATEVVRVLRDAGFEAVWAGGCVRDQLLGRPPKDYDVATNAEPQQIRAVFGHHRTIAVGAAFGVISVLGPKPAGQVDVATFRQDASYSDGRHPDRVTFCNDREDALRRDFTMNGLFFDPLNDELIDYVGGQQDLEQRLVRAIGDPGQRFGEDKLRMLRAVRFASTFDFQIDADTRDAVRRHAAEIRVVSAERIAEELRRMLLDVHRRRAVELLAESRLLSQLLPEAADTWASEPWQEALEILDALQDPTVSVALAALLRPLPGGSPLVRSIGRRWKLSNAETEGVVLCLEHEALLRNAADASWPRLQRVLIGQRIAELLCFAEAVAQVVDGTTQHIEYCRQQLAQPADVLNPPPLVSGDDLSHAGIPPGPRYKHLLVTTRDAQLNGQLETKEEALHFAQRLWEELAE